MRSWQVGCPSGTNGNSASGSNSSRASGRCPKNSTRPARGTRTTASSARWCSKSSKAVSRRTSNAGGRSDKCARVDGSASFGSETVMLALVGRRRPRRPRPPLLPSPCKSTPCRRCCGALRGLALPHRVSASSWMSSNNRPQQDQAEGRRSGLQVATCRSGRRRPRLRPTRTGPSPVGVLRLARLRTRTATVRLLRHLQARRATTPPTGAHRPSSVGAISWSERSVAGAHSLCQSRLLGRARACRLGRLRGRQLTRTSMVRVAAASSPSRNGKSAGGVSVVVAGTKRAVRAVGGA